jgi:hypothetical protein
MHIETAVTDFHVEAIAVTVGLYEYLERVLWV